MLIFLGNLFSGTKKTSLHLGCTKFSKFLSPKKISTQFQVNARTFFEQLSPQTFYFILFPFFTALILSIPAHSLAWFPRNQSDDNRKSFSQKKNTKQDCSNFNQSKIHIVWTCLNMITKWKKNCSYYDVHYLKKMKRVWFNLQCDFFM